MNLGARMFGVSLYVLVLAFFCIIVGKISNKKLKTVLMVYAIILSIMGFFFVPSMDNDLYRTFEIMEYYSNMPFETIIRDYVSMSNAPFALFYYWIIGQFGVNSLLPFITALIFYINIFYIFSDYANKQNISGRALSLGLLIIMCNSSFIEVISGIRTMLSFSIVLRCIYNEVYNNKFIIRDVFWYVIASLIHPASLVLVIFRLIFTFFQRSKSKNRKWVLVVLSIALFTLLINYGGRFIEAMADKANVYIYGDMYSYIWGFIITFLILVALVIIQNKSASFNNANDEERISLKNNRTFSRIIEATMIAFIFEYSIFSRYGNFNLLLNIPIILYYSDLLFKKGDRGHKVMYLYFLGVLFLTCVRGDLSALKFWGGL